MTIPAAVPAELAAAAQSRTRPRPVRQDELYRILDAGRLAHVAYVRGRMPVVVPTRYVREGHSILLPVRLGCPLSRAADAGAALSATITLLDGGTTCTGGIADYRSVLIFARASYVDEARTALRMSLNMAAVRFPDGGGRVTSVRQ
jgi:nitroimidazol reductase NimA-like FMN-containing flavoprotein (pyridoxamine 5'-phosphate oxidase superfamily)